jgi:hypothetical protein
MDSISVLLQLMVLALYTGTVKLAALLYQRTRLGWLHACIFSVIMLALLVGGAYLNHLSDYIVPDLVGIAATVIIQMGVGAWYFAARARRADGTLLDSRGGATLALIAYGFLVPFALAWVVMHSAMMH